MNRWRSSRFSGVGMSWMSRTLSSSGVMPLSVYVFPKNDMLLCLMRHFAELNTNPSSCALSIKLVRFLSWSSLFPPYTHTSSPIPVTPSRPSSIWSTLAWNISCETFNPKGSLRQQNLPNGVRNVVSSCDSSFRWTYQYPALASSLLNSFALASWGFISSNVGILWGASA